MPGLLVLFYGRLVRRDTTEENLRVLWPISLSAKNAVQIRR